MSIFLIDCKNILTNFTSHAKSAYEHKKDFKLVLASSHVLKPKGERVWYQVTKKVQDLQKYSIQKLQNTDKTCQFYMTFKV